MNKPLASVKGCGGAVGKVMPLDADPSKATPPIVVPIAPPKRKDPRRGKMWWVKLTFKDVMTNTNGLSPAAFGAYMRIIFEYLIQLAPVPDNGKRLQRLTGVSLKDWPGIREELSDVFDVIDGNLVDAFAEDAIAEFKKSSEKNRGNRNGGARTANGGLEDADE